MCNKFLYLIFIITVLSGTQVSAQDLLADLKQMRERYAQMESYGAEVKVDIYESERLIQSKRAAIKKDQYQSYYQLDQVTMLLNERFSILVNEEEKVIVLNRHKGKLKDIFNNWESMDPAKIEAILQSYEDWHFVGQANGKTHYQLVDQDGLIQRIDLFLNQKQNMIDQLVYHYNENQTPVKTKVTIQYQNQQIDPEWSKATFSENQFVQKQKGQWQPQPAYRGYELIEPEPLSEE